MHIIFILFLVKKIDFLKFLNVTVPAPQPAADSDKHRNSAPNIRINAYIMLGKCSNSIDWFHEAPFHDEQFYCLVTNGTV